jgi:hypothetical protein
LASFPVRLPGEEGRVLEQQVRIAADGGPDVLRDHRAALEAVLEGAPGVALPGAQAGEPEDPVVPEEGELLLPEHVVAPAGLRQEDVSGLRFRSVDPVADAVEPAVEREVRALSEEDRVGRGDAALEVADLVEAVLGVAGLGVQLP